MSALRSTPAQNAGSAPVRTMASTSSRASHDRDRLGERGGERGIERVARLRSIEGDDRDAVGHVDEDHVLRHPALPSCPSRLALLEERGTSFADVVALSDRVGGSRRRRPPQLVALGDRLLERAQAGPHADRTDRADAVRQRQGCRRPPRRARRPRSPGRARTPRSGSSRSPVSSISLATLSGSARGVRNRPAARRHETSLHLGQPERRRARRHHEVAREHDLEPATERRAFDRRDERLRAVAADDAVLAATSGSPRFPHRWCAPGRCRRRTPSGCR